MIISIVTVTYNAEKVIEKTLKSVLEQTNLNVEYIIKDGNSTDATNKIIDFYKPLFDEKKIYIKHIIESDKGIYNAMNSATQECSGAWVIFLNAGDVFFDKNTVQTFFNYIFYNNAGDVFYGDSISTYNKKSVRRIHDSQYLDKKMSLCHQGCCIKSKIIKEKLYNEQYKIGADYDFFLGLFLEQYKFVKIPMVVCEYDKNGISSTKLVDSYKEFIEIKRTHGIRVPNIFFVRLKIITKYIRELFHIF